MARWWGVAPTHLLDATKADYDAMVGVLLDELRAYRHHHHPTTPEGS